MFFTFKITACLYLSFMLMKSFTSVKLICVKFILNYITPFRSPCFPHNSEFIATFGKSAAFRFRDYFFYFCKNLLVTICCVDPLFNTSLIIFIR